tara:strand:+ start:301 stop:603 length:303 start_codon:yes stop_codon:yes gene_type:complete
MEEIINGLKQIKTKVDSGTITTVNGTETLLSKQLEKMIEAAINYTHCCETLKLNSITFQEFARSFCVKYSDSDYWYYKGIRYNDLELDLVYKQYIDELNL